MPVSLDETHLLQSFSLARAAIATALVPSLLRPPAPDDIDDGRSAASTAGDVYRRFAEHQATSHACQGSRR
jgi:hypothetical protein